MTKEEIEELYYKVEDIIRRASYDSHHMTYICGVGKWDEDNAMYSFDMYCHNDQGTYGIDWTEYWYIDDDGRIHTEDRTYQSLEDFESNSPF